MNDPDCVEFLQWALPQMHLRWPGFRKVRRQVCKRVVRRMHELGLGGVESYRNYLQNHREEWSVLDGFCRIPISRFYRDRGVFDYLRDEILPMIARTARAQDDHTLWCWSAGCASGEEAYTLNILWRICVSSRFPDLTLRVVATDTDPNMLERARRGSYASSSLKDLPSPWLSLAFDHGGGLFWVKPEFGDNIRWRLQDIRRESPPERFRLILCRHLAFTYFDEPLQCQTLDRLADCLSPGGILVTGKQETLPRSHKQLEQYGHRMGLYQKVQASVDGP